MVGGYFFSLRARPIFHGYFSFRGCKWSFASQFCGLVCPIYPKIAEMIPNPGDPGSPEYYAFPRVIFMASPTSAERNSCVGFCAGAICKSSWTVWSEAFAFVWGRFSDFLTSLNFCFKPLPWREFGFHTPTGESPGKELRCCWSWQDVAGVYHTVGSNGFRASFWLYYRTWLVSLVKLHFFTVYGMLPRA